MPVIRIPTERITDWDTFHDVFAEVLGFPDFDRRDMNAWHDCLGYADEDDGMRNVVVPAGDVLTLDLGKSDFGTRCPELFRAVLDGAAFVNYARVEQGERPIIAVSAFTSP